MCVGVSVLRASHENPCQILLYIPSQGGKGGRKDSSSSVHHRAVHARKVTVSLRVVQRMFFVCFTQEITSQRHECSGRRVAGTTASRTSRGPWTPSWCGPKMRGGRSCRPSLTCTTPTSARSSVKHTLTHTLTVAVMHTHAACFERGLPSPQPRHTTHYKANPKRIEDAWTVGSISCFLKHTHTYTHSVISLQAVASCKRLLMNGWGERGSDKWWYNSLCIKQAARGRLTFPPDRRDRPWHFKELLSVL